MNQSTSEVKIHWTDRRPILSYTLLMSLLIIIAFSVSACNNQPPPPVKVAQPHPAVTAGSQAAVSTPAPDEKEVPEQEGYIYEQRDRRDPFVPLIVPKKSVSKSGKAKEGTLESYDLSEFSLAAIAKKGREYFALLTTPDNRSFSVIKGNAIGLNKGKVKDIKKDRIIIVEYSQDYRGQFKARELILEFHKGEVE